MFPRSEVLNSLKHLNQLNINYNTLFPDATGRARHANLCAWEHQYEGTGAWSEPPGYPWIRLLAESGDGWQR